MFDRLTIALIVAFGATACSAPPDKERQQAEGALNAAREADAAAYAPEPLQAAEAALEKYDAAVAQRDYRLALNDALEARDRAYEAVKQAGDRKAELRSQAERLATELDGLIKTGTARLSGLPAQRSASSAAERLRSSLRTAASALQEARARLSKRDYQATIKKLTPITQALRSAVAAVDAPPVKKKK